MRRHVRRHRSRHGGAAGRGTPAPVSASTSIARVRLAGIGVRIEGMARPASLLIGYNLGRITSYTVAGALAGAIGSSAALVRHWLPVQQVAFVAANLLLIAMGLHLAGVLRRITVLEGAGAGLWRRLQPLALLPGRRQPAAGIRRRTGLGLGSLRHGVWRADGRPAVGQPLAGGRAAARLRRRHAANLLLLGASGALTRRWLAVPGLRIGAGVLVIVFGIAGLARIDPTRHLHQVVDACLTLF